MGDQDQALCSMDIASMCHLASGSESISWLCLFSGKYKAGDARRLHKAYFSEEISKRHNQSSALRITWKQWKSEGGNTKPHAHTHTYA